MEKLKTILGWYLDLKKRNKILVGFAVLILVLSAVECLTGCSNASLTKTWSF